MFLVGLIGFSSIQNKSFGENQLKFKEGKAVIYWVVVTL